MELYGRLRLIAEKIPNCGILVDIGTDHAFIPIYSVKNNICKKAIGTDVKKGPIDIARKNIKQHGLDLLIETRQGYGLEPIREDEAEVIVIAGMGGLLIREILQNEFNKAKKARLLILQPMNGPEVVRKFLAENGFPIVDEALAGEQDKIYNVISANWTGCGKENDEFEHYVGAELIKGSDPLLKQYLEKKLRILDTMIEGRMKSESKYDDLEGLVEMKGRLARLIEELI